MSFDVRRSDADAFAVYMSAWASSAIAALEQVGVAGEFAICGLGISGRASEASAAYWREVHAPIIFAANAILYELLTRYGQYLSALSALDGARDARFSSDALERGGTDMASIRGAHDERAGGLSEILADISDIVRLETPSSSVLVGTLDTLESTPRILSDEVESVEETHAASARELADRMDALRVALEGAGSVGAFESYVPGAARSAGWFEALGRAYEASAAFYGENAQDVISVFDDACNRNGERFDEEMERLAAERADQGEAQWVLGMTTVFIGGLAILTSGGALVPFVAPMMVFGAAEFAEGIQEYHHGGRGDITSVSWNPLRDTVFLGNQAVYDGASFVADLSGSFSMPLSSAIGAAKATGAPLLKSIPTFAKTLAIEGAEDWIQDQEINLALKFTVDPLIDSAFGQSGSTDAAKKTVRDVASIALSDFGTNEGSISSGTTGGADTSGAGTFKEVPLS